MNMTDTQHFNPYAEPDGHRQRSVKANQTADASDVPAGNAASGPSVSSLRSPIGVSGDGNQRGAADRAMGLLLVLDVRRIRVPGAHSKTARRYLTTSV